MSGPPRSGRWAPLSLTDPNISDVLSVANGGTGNTTGQPSGAAGGALAGSYPNPSLAPGTPKSVLIYDAAGNPAVLTGGANNGPVIFDAAGVPVVLARGADAQVLTLPAGGGPPAWAAPTASGGWVTALDLDFSAQANQTLNADTTYTIGGVVFKKENSANDSTAMAIVNGSGLVIQPKTTGDYAGAIRTAPFLWLQLSHLGIANLSFATAIRIWVYVSAANYTGNFDNSVIAIDGDNTNWSYAALRGIGGGAVAQMTTRRTISGASTSGQVNHTNDATNNVQVLVVPGVVSGNGGFHHHYGSYSAGWPSETSLSEAGGILDAPGYSSVGGSAAAGNGINNYGIVIGALRAGSATALSVTFARFRVDYRL